jgi:hypothetical protein
MTRNGAHHGQSHILTRLVVGCAAVGYRVVQGGFGAGLDPDFLADAQFDWISFFPQFPN